MVECQSERDVESENELLCDAHFSSVCPLVRLCMRGSVHASMSVHGSRHTLMLPCMSYVLQYMRIYNSIRVIYENMRMLMSAFLFVKDRTERAPQLKL